LRTFGSSSLANSALFISPIAAVPARALDPNSEVPACCRTNVSKSIFIDDDDDDDDVEAVAAAAVVVTGRLIVGFGFADARIMKEDPFSLDRSIISIDLSLLKLVYSSLDLY
jgi:hypothetical protein